MSYAEGDDVCLACQTFPDETQITTGDGSVDNPLDIWNSDVVRTLADIDQL